MTDAVEYKLSLMNVTYVDIPTLFKRVVLGVGCRGLSGDSQLPHIIFSFIPRA